MGRSKIQNMTRCALSAGMMAVCAWITIPGTVPFTMQTFGFFLMLQLLGGRQGTAAVGVYLALGAVGLPVFSGFQGGIGVLLGPTGGFLLGFLVGAGLYWLLTKWSCPKKIALIPAWLCTYCTGAIWFSLYGGVTLQEAITMSVLPFLIPDIIKLALSWVLAKRLQKGIGA